MKFQAKNNIQLSSDIICRVNQDGSVVLMKTDDSNCIYKIEGVAAEMWQCFSEKKSNLGEVINGIAKQYNVEPEKILEDSQEFLTRVQELKFISTT